MEEYLNFKKFNELQNKGKTCVLYFWSSWCSSCLKIRDLKKAEQNYDINVFKINFDENPQIVNHYKIKMVPSYVVIQGFKTFYNVAGNHDLFELRKIL